MGSFPVRRGSLLCALTLGVLLSGRTRAAQVIAWELDGLNRPVSVQPFADGTVLVTDKYNDRLIEVTPQRPSSGSIGWTNTLPSLPDVAHRLPDGHTLIADTGNKKVLEVDAAGNVVWSFGTGNNACNDTDLDDPSDVIQLPSGEYLIVDQAHHRLLRVDAAGNVLWRFGRSDCTWGIGDQELFGPFHVVLLPDGDYLLAQYGAAVITQLHPDAVSATIVWEYGTRNVNGFGPNQLSGPARAVPLANGDILVPDSLNHRVIEIAPTLPSGGNVVWQFGVSGAPGNDSLHLNVPYDAEVMPSGSILIADQFNNRLLELSPQRVGWRFSPGPLLTETCTGPLQLEIQDLDGTAYVPASPVTPIVSASGVALDLFADAACSAPLGPLVLDASRTSDALYVQAHQAGQATLVASAAGYQDGTRRLDFGLPLPPPPALRLGVGCGCHSGADGLSATGLLGVLSWLRLRRRTG